MDKKRKHICHVPVCKGEHFDMIHKFPRDPERASAWLDAVDCPRLKSVPRSKLCQYQICARHFRLEDYKHAQSRSLNKNVVPSLNLKDLSELHLSRDQSPKECTSASPEPCEVVLLSESVEDIIPAESDGIEKDFVSESLQSLGEYYHENDDEDSSVCDETNPDFLEVSHSGYEEKLALNCFWLRCLCRCSLCYDAVTHRRTISPMQIPRNVGPKSVQQFDGVDVLWIEWNDRHISEYDVNFLFNCSKKAPATCGIPWRINRNLDGIQGFAAAEFSQLINSEKTIEITFHSLLRNGVAIIHNIPTGSSAMASLSVCRLFPHFNFVSFKNFNEIHTDISSNLTYSNVDCGLKCFFFTQKSKIILVDGLNVAKQLKSLDISSYELLCQVPVPLEIYENHVKWKDESPVIEVDSETGKVLRLRFDLRRLSILNTVPQEEIEQFYDSLRHLDAIVQDEDNQWAFSAMPGTLVVLDSWRIFHKISDKSGISQCYLGKKDFISRLQHLGLN